MPAVRRTVHLTYTMGHTAGCRRGAARRRPRRARRPPGPRPARAAPRRPGDERAARPDAAQRGAGCRPARTRRRTGAAGRRRPGSLGSSADRRGVGPRRSGVGTGRRAAGVAGAIAADHAWAPSYDATDWNRIVHHYDALLLIEPSPTVAIGRCLAIGQLLGAEAGLADLDEVLAVATELDRYPYAHAGRAQLLARLGRVEESQAAWGAAASGRPHHRRARLVHRPRHRLTEGRSEMCRRRCAHLPSLTVPWRGGGRRPVGPGARSRSSAPTSSPA